MLRPATFTVPPAWPETIRRPFGLKATLDNAAVSSLSTSVSLPVARFQTLAASLFERIRRPSGLNATLEFDVT